MRFMLRHGADRRALRAFAERQELVKAGLTRRDLVKMGVLSTGGVGGGFVLADKSLADDGGGPGPLPPLTPFVEPLPISPVLPERAAAQLVPAPTIGPNRKTNPATGLPFEGRTEVHQSEDRFPPQAFFETRMGATTVKIHPDLPAQTVWGFNKGGADLTADPPLSPGPVLVMRYGRPSIVRRHNALPPPAQNGGFGVPETSTHLHNFHSCPDSDGGPCDPAQQRFFSRGQYYDYFYNMQFAGWGSTNPPNGNIQEALGFLWYHDHRVDHTAENTYKGLVGPAIAFNDFDTGDEQTGFRLPGFKQGFDIPLVFADKLIDPTTGLIAFDTFQNDGLLGNTFLTNGKIQPFLEVAKRRYRFRLLDVGPSRFYQFFLTNPDNLSQSIPFWVIANDGNLLPRPVEVTSHRISVAERVDVIVDFAKIAQRFGNPARIRLENRLEQLDGRGPTGRILPAGRGNQVLEFRLTGGPVTDPSFDPEPVSFPHVPATAGDAVFAPISLPDISAVQPRLTRTFVFGQHDDGWQINDEFMDCTRFRFTAQANTAERWIIQNDGGEWQHPIHIHLEEFRILSRNGVAVKPGNVDFARKDVTALLPDERIEVLMRFRDNLGVYPFHCHNTVHEDHQMMLLFNVAPVGDTKRTP
jgi:FtsP/CotA-like multicopper oxidase with cupredoxin domain